MPGLSQSAFAREAGTSQAAVSKALGRGALVAEGGKLDPEHPANRHWLSLHRSGQDSLGRAIKPELIALPGGKIDEAEEPILTPELQQEIERLLASERDWARGYLDGIAEPIDPPPPKLFSVWEGQRFDPQPAHELVSILFNGDNQPFPMAIIMLETLRQKVAEQLELIRTSQTRAVKALQDELAQALDRITALTRKVAQLEAEATAREGMTSSGSDDLVDTLARVERDGLETRGVVTELMSKVVPLLAKLAGE